jgi:NAD+ diphosphatase
MILPPFAVPQNFKDGLRPEGQKEAYWYIFSGDRLLVSENNKSIPSQHDLDLQRSLYLGTWRERHLFAGEVKKECSAPPGWSFFPLRLLYGALSEEDFAIAGRAMQLLDWDRAHQFCGCCGIQTFVREDERCRECPSCNRLAYPKMAPAIMALVKQERKILLARGPHFPEKFYSVLAGYVDPGETLEQCVVREVFEEVGIKVKNVCYFGSQPWPFSYSLMIGFTCEWEQGEINLDQTELEDAGWFDKTNLPQLPLQMSLARHLIDAGLN